MPTRECKPPIMIVDDSADDIAILQRHLKAVHIDANVLTFVDSAEALAFLRELDGCPECQFLQPGLMFLDLQMPKVHGFVFLKWVRSQAWLDEMKLIVLSGSDKPEDRDRAMKLGADRYLVKFPETAVFAELMAGCYA